MKELPQITHEHYGKIASIIRDTKGLSSFDPFFGPNEFGYPFSIVRDPYKGYRIYNLKCAHVNAKVAFHNDPNEWPGCSTVADRTCGDQRYRWAEIEAIISEVPGKGNGIFMVHLLDAFFARIANNTSVPLFVFADDDSKPQRWTTAAFQSVGYSLAQMGILERLHIRKPRLYRWYQPSRSSL